MTTIPLPSSLQYGKVVGTVMQAVLDATDVNELPEGAGVTGTVTFTSLGAQGRVVDGVFVFFPPIVVSVNASGVIETRAGQPGVWLPTGPWVAFFDTGRLALPDIYFEVLASHTQAAPLNIFGAIPPLGDALTPDQFTVLNERLEALETAGAGGGTGEEDLDIDGGTP